MPDLDTLSERAARRGVTPARLKAAPEQLVREMWRSEMANLKTSAVALGLALLALAVFGVTGWLAVWAFHSGVTNFEAFPHGVYWVTYLAIVLTLTLGACVVRPRSTYGTGHGPYTMGQDPLFWREGPLGVFQNVLRFLLAVPNALRMALYNLLSVGHLRRLKENGDLALFALLAAEKRIVAEEILVLQRKKRPADLWSVIPALARMEFLRYERLRHELVIWRGQAAEQMLGMKPEA